ncbi:MAG: hypothetical protein HUJ25_17995 [Crocinitomicaceae bacterium]|nr:hypothetical protein [Crocinitomicaceae bacterium]
MRKIDYFLVVTALVPATLLLGLTLLALSKIAEGPYKSGDIPSLLTSILGIIGYLGLTSLLFGQIKERPRVVLVSLLAGLLAFVWFTSLGGWTAWQWVLLMEEPGEWFIYVWPAIITFYFVLKLIRIVMRGI